MTNKNNKKNTAGFTLLIAIVVTSMLLLVSFVIVDIALKQVVLSNDAMQSQYAFYNADTGTECALYWDLKNPGGVSAFATDTPGVIACNAGNNGNPSTISTNSQTVPTIPSEQSLIGGGGAGNPVSIFEVNLSQGCVIVRVTKNTDNSTTIDSRGYNTCDLTSGNRLERGVTLTY